MKTLEERVEAFIRNAKEAHKDENYDYSKVLETYTNNRTKVCIIDRSLDENGMEYGEFWVTPSNLLKGRKNPATKGKRISNAKSMTQDEFIKRCKEVHKDPNLDFSKVVYKGAHEKVYVIDNTVLDDGSIVGGYWVEANSLVRGHRHPKIGLIRMADKQRCTTEDFIRKARLVHGDKYDYSKSEYVGSQVKLTVTCPIHGDFETNPDNHLAGKGCPSCGVNLSKREDELYQYLCELLPDTEIIRSDRTILDGHEIDVYIPSKGIAFEYNGLRWHNEKYGKNKWYHLRKTEGCLAKGIYLIHIFEDEWIMKHDLVRAKIRHIVGAEGDKEKVMGRKCEIREIGYGESRKFLDSYHIQGSARATVYFGAFYDGRLIGVMSFRKEGFNGNCWELVRFATDYNLICQGVGGKLFGHFIKEYDPETVKTFLDRRWLCSYDDNLYVKIGFVAESFEKPDYAYTNGNGERKHKFGFRKKILNKKYGLPLTMTESQMTDKLGYYKIWNCGLVKYVWRKK